ncbi:reverse transcriptase [Trichonephila clavipes]|nr:reverse transcriptase [Trichonephila clavipes]
MTRRAPIQFYSTVATALPSERLSLTYHQVYIYTCQKQTERARDGSVGCLRALWPWERTPPTTMVKSWLSEKLQVNSSIIVFTADLAPAKVIFFIDSQAAILAFSSNTPTDCLNTIQCQTKIAELISYCWTAALQRAKSIISTHIDKYAAMTQKTKSFGKPWETLATVGPIPGNLERVEAVARFRLTTGHHFLRVYLHWLIVVANEACPLCGYARMDGDHMLQCTGLVEYPADDLVSRY